MKATPSLLGLALEIIALAAIAALILLGKAESPEIAIIALAGAALYLVAVYHFRIEKRKPKEKLKKGKL